MADLVNKRNKIDYQNDHDHASVGQKAHDNETSPNQQNAASQN